MANSHVLEVKKKIKQYHENKKASDGVGLGLTEGQLALLSSESKFYAGMWPIVKLFQTQNGLPESVMGSYFGIVERCTWEALDKVPVGARAGQAADAKVQGQGQGQAPADTALPGDASGLVKDPSAATRDEPAQAPAESAQNPAGARKRYSQEELKKGLAIWGRPTWEFMHSPDSDGTLESWFRYNYNLNLQGRAILRGPLPKTEGPSCFGTCGDKLGEPGRMLIEGLIFHRFAGAPAAEGRSLGAAGVLEEQVEINARNAQAAARTGANEVEAEGAGGTGRGLFGKPSPPPSGPISAELRQVYLKQIESKWFQTKLRAYAALTGKGEVQWAELAEMVESAEFREYATAWEAAKSGGFAGLKDGKLILGMGRAIRKIPILGRSALQHELVHVYQEMTMGTLAKEAAGSLSWGSVLRVEAAANLFGSPAVIIFFPAVIIVLVSGAAYLILK